MALLSQLFQDSVKGFLRPDHISMLTSSIARVKDC
jgi:hypothetical protein